MIRLITKIEDGMNVIRDADAFFSMFIDTSHLTSLDLRVMNDIDSAKLIDADLGTIVTKFGTTDIFRLSTSCKIVMSYLYMSSNRDKYGDWILEVTDAGSNALKILFEIINSQNELGVMLLLRRNTGLRQFRDIQCEINGEYYDSLYKAVMRNASWFR